MIIKKTFVIFFLVLVGKTSLFASYDYNYIQVSDYIRCWGLVKYHQDGHNYPCMNMDSVFLKHISQIYQGKLKKRNFNKIVNELTNGMHIDFSNEKMINMEISPDISWINNSVILNNENKTKLKSLAFTPLSGNPCYYYQIDGNAQIKFKKENTFLNPYPSVEYRLLLLSKYWNMVQYFYAYKGQIKIDWNEILNQYCIGVTTANNAEELHLQILELSNNLNDSHVSTTSFVIESFWGGFQLPIRVRKFHEKVIITELLGDDLSNNPFLFGDEIIRIDSLEFKKGFDLYSKYVSGSNLGKKKQNYCEFFCRTQENKILDVELVRGGDTLIVKSPTYHLWDSSISKSTNYFNHKSAQIFNDSIGYLDLSKVTKESFPKDFGYVKHTKYLIVDLRNYPNLILDSLGENFFNEQIVFSNWYSPNGKIPGGFINRPALKIGKTNPSYYRGKFVLLVNYETQSRGEFFTMALQRTDNNITIGSQTSGADGNVVKANLPCGINTSFSGIGIEYPNGTITQGNGVLIDVVYHPKGNLVNENKDEELNFVLVQILNNNLKF